MTTHVSPPVQESDREVDAGTRETLEDYTLRFAPRSYRTWSTGVVAISALGGIAYLADFAVGANIGISYGKTNALWGIAIFAVVIYEMKGTVLRCHVRGQDYACSLCLSTDKVGDHVLPARA